MRKRIQKEESMQIQVSAYIKLAYPKVIFTAESSGLRLPIGLAIKAKKQRSGRALPDLWIDAARGGFFGLRLELKKLDQSPYKKDGSLKKQMKTKPNGEKYDHIQEQAETLRMLRDEGYFAEFAVGFDQARQVIDWYMELPKSKQGEMTL